MTPKLTRLYDSLDSISKAEDFDKFLEIISSLMKARQLRYEADNIEEHLAMNEEIVLQYARVATLSPDEQLMAHDHIKARIRIKKEKEELENLLKTEKSNREEIDRVKQESEELAAEMKSDEQPLSEVPQADESVISDELKKELGKQIIAAKKQYFSDDIPLLEVDH